jgi:hypothetical protein
MHSYLCALIETVVPEVSDVCCRINYSITSVSVKNFGCSLPSHCYVLQSDFHIGC